MLVIFYMVVDLVGSAVIYSVGTPATGVSVEINVSYLDAAFTVVSISPTPVLVKLIFKLSYFYQRVLFLNWLAHVIMLSNYKIIIILSSQLSFSPVIILSNYKIKKSFYFKKEKRKKTFITYCWGPKYHNIVAKPKTIQKLKPKNHLGFQGKGKAQIH